MPLPNDAVVRVSWNVTTPNNSNSLIPGGSIAVIAATDEATDGLIRAELENRRTTYQGQADTLTQILDTKAPQP